MGPVEPSKDQEPGEAPARKGPRSPESSPLMGRYRILGRIGRGGMGEVWSAEDTALNVKRALKVLPRELVKSEVALASLRREAELTARLSHPHIVPLRTIEMGLNRNVFLVFDYVAGWERGGARYTNLSQWLKAEGRLSEEDVRRLLPPILDALQYAHTFSDDRVQDGIVHRDIKPSNVLLDSDGRPLLADFGIARAAKDTMGAEYDGKRAPGTLLYISPEQLKGKPGDARSDVYSLGIMVYELLAGKPPFREGDIAHQHLHESPAWIEGVSGKLNRIIQRALAKNPAERWQSCAEIRQELETPEADAQDSRSAAGIPVDSGSPSARATPPTAPAVVKAAPVAGPPPGRTAIPKPPPPPVAERKGVFASCPACGSLNELPYVFCEKCSAARVKFGGWRATINVSLSTSALLGAFYFVDFITWPWPLYALYAFFLVQFASSLVRGQWRLVSRVWSWFGLFFAGFAAVCFVAHRDGPDILLIGLTGAPDYAAENPWVFFPILGAILTLIALPFYFHWGRKYGWVSAYRILMLALIALGTAIIGTFHTVDWVQRRGWFPLFDYAMKTFVSEMPDYDRALILGIVNVARLFLFEIFIFAAVRAYTMVHQAPAAPVPPALENESAFTRSLFVMAQIFRRFAHWLEHMVLYMIELVVLLARDIWSVFCAVVRELIAPSVSLTLSGVLLYVLAAETTSYIEHNSLASVLVIVAGVVGLVGLEMVFLGCKTPFHWRRVFAFHVQLIGWLLPTLLLFFLLISVILAASSAALRPDTNESPLPFRIGLLTKGVALLLAGLVGFVFLRKKSLFQQQAPATASESQAAAGQPRLGAMPGPMAGSPPPPVRRETPVPIGRPSREAAPEATGGVDVDDYTTDGSPKPGAIRRILSRARSIGETRTLQDAMSAARKVSDRLKGKPAFIDELAKCKESWRDKSRQLEALEASRSTISERTFETLRHQYKKELRELTEKRDKLQVDVDLKHADLRSQRTVLVARLAELERETAESESLLAAGALSKKDYDFRMRKIRSERELAALQKEGCENRISHLEPEATPRPSGL